MPTKKKKKPSVILLDELNKQRPEVYKAMHELEANYLVPTKKKKKPSVILLDELNKPRPEVYKAMHELEANYLVPDPIKTSEYIRARLEKILEAVRTNSKI
jgi:ATP-dependent Clp protease ATP-binding subunit ClpA